MAIGTSGSREFLHSLGVITFTRSKPRDHENDRLRQPVQPEYAHALGHAAYCFALCEWQVVWCCERIHSGSLSKIVGEELTAGRIAKCFLDLTRSMPRANDRARLKRTAQKFATLVEDRNHILHGKPCTSPSGDACLSGSKIYEIPDLEDAADSFSACSIELNELYWGFLSTFKPA